MLKKLLLLSISILASLFLLEVYIRVFNPLGFRIKGAKLELPVNITYIYENPIKGKKIDNKILISRNSIGFRGEDPPFNLSDHLTVVTIGGSTTEGTALSEGDTWTDKLGEKLSNNFKDIWINNAGLDGHSTFGHKILLSDYISKLRPDYALFLIGINDLGLAEANIFDKETKATRTIHTFAEKLVSLSEYSNLISYIDNFRRHRKAVEAGLVFDKDVDYRVLGTADISKEELNNILASHRPLVKEYADRLGELIELSRKYKIEPVFVTQPALYGYAIDDITGIDLSKMILSEGNGEINVGLTGSAGWEILELYNQATKAVGQEKGVLVIDLASEMPKSSRYYYDFVHFTKEGAEKAAEILYRQLCDYLETREEKHVIKRCNR